MDETFMLLARRAGYGFAAQRARNIYASEWLRILRPDKNDELKAIDIFEKYSNHHLSFTDCISIVLIQRKKIKRVFTFDHHFQIFGFQIYPNKISMHLAHYSLRGAGDAGRRPIFCYFKVFNRQENLLNERFQVKQ